MELKLNCFVLGDPNLEGGIFQVTTQSTDTVIGLRRAIHEAINDKVDQRRLLLFKASLPIEKFNEVISSIKMADADALKPVHLLSSSFPSPPLPEFVHIFVRFPSAPDLSGMVVTKLERNHARLFTCLKVTVAKVLDWTEPDVRLNGGTFLDNVEEIPPEMMDLENRLRQRRRFSESSYPRKDNLTMARRCPQFSRSYFKTTRPNDHQATVQNDLEFLTFYYLLSCYLPDALRFQGRRASSMKASAVKSNFIYPPFFYGGKSTDELVYVEESSWRFPMFVDCNAMVDLPLKYRPRNDFCVWFEAGSVAVPLIIGEIISFQNEMDRYRMLLQAVALARLVSALCKAGSTEQLFIAAIYVTKNLIAERYIVMQSRAESNKVLIVRKDFDLTEENGAIDFQREMYNLASTLKSAIDELDRERCKELVALRKETAGMKSLHSKDNDTMKTHKTDGKGGRMDTILEEGQGSEPQEEDGQGSEPEDEDGLGVFGDPVISAVLNSMNYKVAYVAYGFSHIAPIMDRTTGDLIGCLKFVPDGEKETEIGILQYLAALPSELNHTVRPFGIWPVAGGSIIAMPAAGNRLTYLTDLDAHLWSLARQLFEAVGFMHDHNVAHLDLKPANVLVPSTYGRLTVIDFGSSVRLRNKMELRQDHAGTPGYMAPEVGRTKFSPIRADLWSVGQVVKELCMLCRPSTYRDRLSDLSERLLNDNPSKRPMMSEVLERMLKPDAFEEGRALTARGERLRSPKAIAPTAIISRPTIVA